MDNKLDRDIAKIPELLNEVSSLIAKYANLKYHVLIYKLLKRGHITVRDLAEDTGLSDKRLYQIVDAVEKMYKEETL